MMWKKTQKRNKMFGYWFGKKNYMFSHEYLDRAFCYAIKASTVSYICTLILNS